MTLLLRDPSVTCVLVLLGLSPEVAAVFAQFQHEHPTLVNIYKSTFLDQVLGGAAVGMGTVCQSKVITGYHMGCWQ